MRECLDDMRVHHDAIADGFEQFFPDLIRYSEERRAELIHGQGA
jgi:hypothetical protein